LYLPAGTVAVSSGAVVSKAISAGRIRSHADVNSQRLQLLNEHVEGLRNSRLGKVLTFHDRLVNSAAAVHIVRLDGENLLQRMCGAVSLECPHFHLSETLAAELRLTGERLLRDERVGPDAPRVNLVIDQVRQLEHVDLADRHRIGEALTGPAIAQPDLSTRRNSSQAHQLESRCVDLDVRLLGAEDRGQRRQLLRGQY